MDIDEFYAYIEYVISKADETEREALEQAHHEEMGDTPVYTASGDLVWIDEAADEPETFHRL